MPLTAPEKAQDVLALYSAFRGVDWVAAAPGDEVQKRLAALASEGQIVTAMTPTDARSVLPPHFRWPPANRFQESRSIG